VPSRRRGLSKTLQVEAVRDSLRHHLKPRNRRVALSTELPFGREASQYFKELVTGTEIYLEYGAGASTLMAHELRCHFVTVESDAYFLELVEDECLSLNSGREKDFATFIHADIGRTGAWGKPVFPSFPRPTKWKSYAAAPWATLGRDFRAAAILIDGRFRVACALTVALQQPDDPWILMFDDYTERREYWAVEEFLQLKRFCGRMAIFEPSPGIDRNAAIVALEHYNRDWR